MPESLLAVLKFCLLALLWLFFVRVLWAVWAEVRAPAPVPAARRAGGPGAGAAGGGAGARGGAGGEGLRLRVVEPAASRGTTYDLADELTIGRAAGCQVALADDSYASQLHARLYRQDGRLWLEDLGSTNGTYLNAKAVTSPVALRRGDRVQVGRTVLEVSR